MRLFDELWVEAYRRDHARLADITNIIHGGYESRDLVGLGRLVSALHLAYDEFDAQLLAVGREHRLRIRRLPPLCHYCADPHCPGTAGAGVIMVVS